MSAVVRSVDAKRGFLQLTVTVTKGHNYRSWGSGGWGIVTYKSGLVTDSVKLSGRARLIAMVYERD